MSALCYIINTMNISSIHAREILDSRGNPTVEATVKLENGLEGIASVPSGASTGSYEAVELRDTRAERYNGKGVLHAVKNVEETIAAALQGHDVFDQEGLDKIMIDLDATPNKSKLGANAILAVSLAAARAGAAAADAPLYAYLRRFFPEAGTEYIMPLPLMNVLNGGAHAGWVTDIQEYMIIPQGETMAERIERGEKTYQALKEVIAAAGYETSIGDEGGFAPEVKTNEEPFELVLKAIEKAGYKAGTDIKMAIDAAASEWHKNGQYQLKKGGNMDSAKLSEWYRELVKKYPLISLEDPFGEDDWATWTAFTAALPEISGATMQIVGDDLYVTNVQRLQRGIQAKATTAILIKPNQIGSLSETIAAIKLAQSSGLKTIISHRSGETMDDFIADLAVAANAGQIKAGAPARGERVAKYNRLLEIERELNTVKDE